MCVCVSSSDRPSQVRLGASIRSCGNRGFVGRFAGRDGRRGSATGCRFSGHPGGGFGRRSGGYTGDGLVGLDVCLGETSHLTVTCPFPPLHPAHVKELNDVALGEAEVVFLCREGWGEGCGEGVGILVGVGVVRVYLFVHAVIICLCMRK